MYPGYLGSFYNHFKEVKNMPYQEHYNLLLTDTTEFAGSYTRTLRRLGVDAECIIANDSILQNKWKSENGSKGESWNNILFEQIKKNQPEVLWIEDLNCTDTDFLTTIKNSVKSIKLIIAYHCSPFNPKIYDRLNHVDFVLTCTPGLKLDMENKGFRSYLVYHGFDIDLLPKIKNDNTFPQNNFVFSGSLATGSGYHEKRIELVEGILKANIDLALYVNLEQAYKIRAKQFLFRTNEFLRKLNLDKIRKLVPLLQYNDSKVNNYSRALLERKHEPVFGLDMYRLFTNSKIVLNLHIGAAGDYAGNMRLFEVTGIGSCILTDNKKNIGDLFVPDAEVVVYSSVEDCIEKAKWLLDHEDERAKIAFAGQQKTLSFHTVEKRCITIMEIINNELNNSSN
jgi:spore maturation protein CgeB